MSNAPPQTHPQRPCRPGPLEGSPSGVCLPFPGGWGRGGRRQQGRCGKGVQCSGEESFSLVSPPATGDHHLASGSLEDPCPPAHLPACPACALPPSSLLSQPAGQRRAPPGQAAGDRSGDWPRLQVGGRLVTLKGPLDFPCKQQTPEPPPSPAMTSLLRAAPLEGVGVE